LTSHGNPIPRGLDFDDEMDRMHAQDDWGQNRTLSEDQETGVYDYDELRGVRPSDSWQEPYLRSPRVSHYGRYCNLLPRISHGQRTRRFSRYGEPLSTRGNWNALIRGCDPGSECTGPDPDLSAFEGWTTDSADSSRGVLYFDIDDEFVQATSTRRLGAERSVVVKIHFTVDDDYRDGERGGFRLRYHGVRGWQSTDPVRLDTIAGLNADSIHTATFVLDDALLTNGGPDSVDLAIEHTLGAHAVVLAMRVIDPDRENSNVAPRR